MSQSASTACLALIRSSEGCRLTTYLDVAGVPTIGWGHRLAIAEHYPNGITQAQADSIFVGDVAEVISEVLHLVKVPLTQGQLDALVDFVFNLGVGRLASSTLLKDLNEGQYDAVADQILLWDHAAGKELPALKGRRIAEVALWHS